ncbi:putative transcription factor bHLH family [Lupinus albus]|uniref:Putative transcription factor bHLH family n=1 Tax=Lupinus albus TaxID=3870 RepID=A0A6A4PTP5_LUPAL|nr:putative transcription factor bHLH family [Lupinus albus]
MARSGIEYQEELEEDEEEEHFTVNNSSPHKVKVDEPNMGKRVNPHRSKHSETEQRRRCKINERFQVLRDLIPQNDQKRDKASFLLEVIQYIHFLQEKLQIYEQSYEGWNQEPMKLIPWRNHNRPTENNTDPSQAIQNGSAYEKNEGVSLSFPKNMQNPIESDLSTTTIQKGYTPGLTTDAVPMGMQMQLDMFDPVVSSGMPTQHLQQPVSSADIPSHNQPQVWPSKTNTSNYAVPNNSFKEQEELSIESGSESISSAYSQGILDTLKQGLHSSGVDLSQVTLSVQIDVGRRAKTGLTPLASGLKGHEKQIVNNEAMACSGVDYYSEDSEQSLKRVRRE